MHTVNVRQLKNNPSEALRKAEEDVVVVMNGEHPSAVLVHLDKGGTLEMPGIRLALGHALFKDGGLSLARAAKLAQLPLPEFMQHLSRLGTPIIKGSDKDVKDDVETLEAWLATS